MGCICNSEKSLKEKNNQTQLNANNNLKLYNQENILQEAQNINELDKNNDNQKLTINKKIYTEETLPTEKDLNKKNKNNEIKEIQPIKEEDIYLKEEKEKKEREEKEKKEKEEKERKEKEEKERKDKEKKEREEKEKKEKEEKEKKEKEEKEKKENEEIQSMEFTPSNFKLELFNKLELKKHNELRKKHHVNDLIINNELMKNAQKYAEKMAKTNKFQHSNDKERELTNHKGEWVGENIYFFWSSAKASYNSGSASESWYDEIKDYDFNKGGSSNGGVVGHFTQVVWKNTKEVGFGLAFNKNQCYVVGNYYPGGNFNRQEKNNVFPE